MHNPYTNLSFMHHFIVD